MIQYVFGVKYFYLTLIDSIIYLYPIKHCNTMIQYNTSCFLPAFLPVVKYFYLTHVKHSNQIKHAILYYHITAFGGTRDTQGFTPCRDIFHFSQSCQTSAGAQVHHLKQSSPNLPLRFHLSLLSLPYPIFPNSSIVPLPSVYPHHRLTIPSSPFPSIPYFSIPPHTSLHHLPFLPLP